MLHIIRLVQNKFGGFKSFNLRLSGVVLVSYDGDSSVDSRPQRLRLEAQSFDCHNSDVRSKDTDNHSPTECENQLVAEKAMNEDPSSVWLHLPQREQSSEEKARTRQFAREGVELLRNYPR